MGWEEKGLSDRTGQQRGRGSPSEQVARKARDNMVCNGMVWFDLVELLLFLAAAAAQASERADKRANE